MIQDNLRNDCLLLENNGPYRRFNNLLLCLKTLQRCGPKAALIKATAEDSVDSIPSLRVKTYVTFSIISRPYKARSNNGTLVELRLHIPVVTPLDRVNKRVNNNDRHFRILLRFIDNNGSNTILLSMNFLRLKFRNTP